MIIKVLVFENKKNIADYSLQSEKIAANVVAGKK